MSEMQHSVHMTSEHELELEVARLRAELAAAKGEDPADATTRFLAMAAATVEQAVADARREADELAHEISAVAEARRDEATRLAAEAETTAERLLAEADRAQEIITDAEEQADSIRSAALAEAEELVASERARMADERTTLTDVRESLELERQELEVYRAGLRSRVENLAQAMLAIMTTDLGPASRLAVEDLLIPALQPVLDPRDDETDHAVDDALDDEADHAVDHTLEDETDHAVDVETDDTVDESGESVDVGVVEAGTTEDVAPEPADGWWGGVPVTDVVADETGGTEQVEDPEDTVQTEDPEPADEADTGSDDEQSPDLFARASEDETTLPRRVGSLFGAHGEWRVEQTSPEDLAEALAEDERTDAAFEEFLTGDDAPDKSRDWLLRNENS